MLEKNAVEKCGRKMRERGALGKIAGWKRWKTRKQDASAGKKQTKRKCWRKMRERFAEGNRERKSREEIAG